MASSRHRVLGFVFAMALALSGHAPVQGAEASAPIGVERASLDSAGAPMVTIAAGAASVREAAVTVTVAAPAGPASWLRLSLDGGATWVERSYATTFVWSLVDETAGGIDADGVKTLTVESGDGSGAWSTLGADTVLLDRAGPVIGSVTSPGISTGWDGWLVADATDAGVGVDHTDVSLDGTHWRLFDPTPFSWWPGPWIDYREGTIGGSWDPGPRTVHLRSVDRLGNVGPEYSYETAAGGAVRESELPAVYEFPLPAVTGQPFTVKPIFDAGFRVPADAMCSWHLRAGTLAERLQAAYGPTYIGVAFTVPPKNGLCEPWTFTLPYTPTLEYTWSLATRDADGAGLGSNAIAGSFRASLGSTSRAVTTSSLPLYYVVPDRDYVADDATVTYRLHAAGGAPARTGLWSCFPANYDGPWPLVPQEQTGGTSFRCHVNRAGPWVAEWYYERGNRYYLAGYDPVGDPKPPTVTVPVVRPGGAGGPGAASQPVSVSWSGRDRGTGIVRYQLQRSINGGSYRTVALPSARATSVELRLHAGDRYRFRVRARDRAGNRSAWAYSAPAKAVLYQETSGAFAWSSGWSRVSSPGASGGAVRVATTARQTATFRFSGRAVGWFAARGPGKGFAQVFVDGTLVATVNLEASVAQPPRVVWRRSWSGSAAHVVRIRLLGTAGRPLVEVDAMEVVR